MARVTKVTITIDTPDVTEARATEIIKAIIDKLTEIQQPGEPGMMVEATESFDGMAIGPIWETGVGPR